MYTIYKAEKKDLIELCDMWFELQMHHRNMATYIKEIEDWRSKKEKELLLVLESKNFQIFVARHYNRAVGYIRGCIKELSPIYINPRVGFIDELFVKEEVRRTGTGKKLVEHMNAWFMIKAAGEININVSFDNADAREFWHGLDFGIVSQRMAKKIR